MVNVIDCEATFSPFASRYVAARFDLHRKPKFPEESFVRSTMSVSGRSLFVVCRRFDAVWPMGKEGRSEKVGIRRA